MQPNKKTDTTETNRLPASFELQLREVLWMKKALIKTIPKMAEYASDENLIISLRNHHKENKDHVVKLEQVFRLLRKNPESLKNTTMESAIQHADKTLDQTVKGVNCDPDIIESIQRIKNFELKYYVELREKAESLNLVGAIINIDTILANEQAFIESISNKQNNQ